LEHELRIANANHNAQASCFLAQQLHWAATTLAFCQSERSQRFELEQRLSRAEEHIARLSEERRMLGVRRQREDDLENMQREATRPRVSDERSIVHRTLHRGFNALPVMTIDAICRLIEACATRMGYTIDTSRVNEQTTQFFSKFLDDVIVIMMAWSSQGLQTAASNPASTALFLFAAWAYNTIDHSGSWQTFFANVACREAIRLALSRALPTPWNWIAYYAI